jgi:uncharacterized protein YdaU (DUF1376 family)
VNHYPKHIGDWMTATAHLSEVEECVYSRMTDQYYAREAPLPLDVIACCRLVRASNAAARKAVPTVLREFFSEQPDGWHQKRCDEEIAGYHKGDSEREQREANERERVRRHREERATLFAQLRVAGIVPKWDASISQLRGMVAGNGLVTRTEALPVTACNGPATANQNREPEPEPEELQNREVAIPTDIARGNGENFAIEDKNDSKTRRVEHWSKTAAGITATARTLGIERRSNESDEDFKDRVFVAVNAKRTQDAAHAGRSGRP